MKNILILNFARMGDIIEAMPLAAGLKKAYPQARVDMAIDIKFQGICRDEYPVDHLIPLDLSSFLQESMGTKCSLMDDYRHLGKLISPLQEVEYELIINFSHTMASGYLAALLKGKDIRGLCFDRHRIPLINHPWMQYFWTMLRNRDLNSFNLVDIHLMSADLLPEEFIPSFEITPQEDIVAQELLHQEGVNDQDLLIGIQPGANDEAKRWSASSFGTLAAHLQEEHGARICLFGIESEKSLGEEILKHVKKPLVNLIGRTTLSQLAALLKRCRMLITNDTGSMHLASAVGTQLIVITLGNAYSQESGPYSTGQIILQPDLPCFPCESSSECPQPICKTHIPVDAVLACVRMVLKGEEIPRLGTDASSLFHNILLTRTDFDQRNLLEHIPLTKRPLTEKDCFQFLYREMWVRSLHPPWRKDSFIYEEFISTLEERYCFSSAVQVGARLGHLKNGFQNLSRMARQGITLLEKVLRLVKAPSSDPRFIEKSLKRVAGLDEEIEQSGLTSRFILLLCHMFQFQKNSVKEDEFESMVKSSLQAYRDLHWRANFMKRTLEDLERSLSSSISHDRAACS